MSMPTDIDLTINEEDEGPEGHPSPAPLSQSPVIHQPGLVGSPGFRAGPGGYFSVGTPHHTPTPGTQDSWFRMHYIDRTPDVGPTVAALHEADERRKFEGLIPEHLPNSPLCPLHPKYVGPSKGLCYWHGRKSNGWGVEPRGGGRLARYLSRRRKRRRGGGWRVLWNDDFWCGGGWCSEFRLQKVN